MSQESFIAIMQAWMRSKGLTLLECNREHVLSKAEEHDLLLDLIRVLDDAYMSRDVFGGRTRQIDPETLARAIEESKKPEAKKL